MIRRTYQCPDCEHIFTIECESDAPDPSCPNPDCDKVLEWRPQSFAIGGSYEGKAVNLAQEIMEKDYGLTNFKDNAKAGETGIVRRQETKVETEIVNRTMSEYIQQTQSGATESAKTFWGNNVGAPTTLGTVTGQQMIAVSKVGPQGPDPMGMLHQGVKKGSIPSPKQMLKVVAAAEMQNPARKAKG